jgi:Rhs element Vgr protein
MPDTRTLPIAAAHREFTVKAGGQPVPREHQLVSLSVSLAANRIASARLAYVDGVAATGAFALSDSELFKPGQRIEISAGAGREQDVLFVGIVVRHGVKVSERTAAQLVVDCRHAASKMTVTPRSSSHFDKADSDIMAAVITASGLQGEVEATTTRHPQVLQYDATDWDFLLARARANGQLAWCEGEKIVVRKAALSGATVCTLQYGSTLLEFAGEIDSRQQVDGIHGIAWDPAQQALIDVEGAAPRLAAPGNLSSAELAAVAGRRLDLRHAPLSQPEAQAWADGNALYRRLDQVCGRGKCVGIGSVRPGAVVELAGLGQRFNGKVFVTGVRHEFSLVQGWKTHVQFGGVLDAPAKPAPASLLPTVSGLQIGIVSSNEDPVGEHRVRVHLPLLGLADDGIWARVASIDAGNDRGFFFRPEIGDEVVVGFFGEDPRHPVVLGMLHSSAKAAPLAGSDDNHEKGYKSRSGMRLHFDDEKTVLTIDTPAGNALVLDDGEKSLTLADQHGNKIVLDADGIRLESIKAFVVQAGTEATLESGTGFALKGGTELKLEGATQAELSSAATTAIKGGIVQIN